MVNSPDHKVVGEISRLKDIVVGGRRDPFPQSVFLYNTLIFNAVW